MRVDLEPPLTVARSGTVMTTRAHPCQGHHEMKTHHRSWIHEGARGKGPIEESLDGGESTHRWSRVSVRGATVTLTSSLSLSRPSLSVLWCGTCKNRARRRKCKTRFLHHKIFAKLRVHYFAFLEKFSQRK
jgi:hypothetical protein